MPETVADRCTATHKCSTYAERRDRIVAELCPVWMFERKAVSLTVVGLMIMVSE
jgi:hypothetical protein